MLGFIKRWFSHDTPREPVDATSAPATAPAAETPPHRAVPEPVTATPTPASSPSLDEDSIGVSLKALLGRWPQALQSQVKQPPATDVQIRLPLSFVLEQLPRGAVMVPFGQLKQKVPPGVFSATQTQDTTGIPVPLDLVIPHLKPEYLRRRPGQRTMTVTTELGPVFGPEKPAPSSYGEISHEPVSEPTTLEPAPLPIPPETPQPAAPVKARPDPAVSQEVKTAPSLPPQPVPVREPQRPSPQPQPIVPEPVRAAAPTPSPLAPGRSGLPSLAPPPAATPAAPEAAEAAPATPSAVPVPSYLPHPIQPPPPKPETPIQFSPPPPAFKADMPVPPPTPVIAPLASLTAPDVATTQGQPLLLIVETVSALWPASTREELKQFNLLHTQVALPAEDVEQGLKQGRWTVTWKQVCSWMRPPLPTAATATPGDTLLEIPLSAIRPPHAPPEPVVPPQSHAAPPTVVAALVQAPPEPGCITVRLEAVTHEWPAAVQEGLARMNLAGAFLALPQEEVEPGLKQGKLNITWQQLCSWMRPAVSAAATRVPADSTLALPLNVIVPLFLAQQKPAKPKRKISVTESIPDVFYAIPTRSAPETAPAAAAAVAAPMPAPTSSPAPFSYVPPPTGPAVPQRVPHEPKVPIVPVPLAPFGQPETAQQALAALGRIFGQEGKEYWTPIELVQRSTTLPGVAGGLIAMHDGLLVANQLPQSMNGETLAAFLPQMFNRMQQYTKELKWGEVSSFNFVVDNTPIQIFNAGHVFFTVLGRTGQALPMPQLQAIAAYLDHQYKHH